MEIGKKSCRRADKKKMINFPGKSTFIYMMPSVLLEHFILLIYNFD